MSYILRIQVMDFPAINLDVVNSYSNSCLAFCLCHHQRWMHFVGHKIALLTHVWHHSSQCMPSVVLSEIKYCSQMHDLISLDVDIHLRCMTSYIIFFSFIPSNETHCEEHELSEFRPPFGFMEEAHFEGTKTMFGKSVDVWAARVSIASFANLMVN